MIRYLDIFARFDDFFPRSDVRATASKSSCSFVCNMLARERIYADSPDASAHDRRGIFSSIFQEFSEIFKQFYTKTRRPVITVTRLGKSVCSKTPVAPSRLSHEYIFGRVSLCESKLFSCERNRPLPRIASTRKSTVYFPRLSTRERK